jgi:hypothetical protein
MVVSPCLFGPTILTRAPTLFSNDDDYRRRVNAIYFLLCFGAALACQC